MSRKSSTPSSLTFEESDQNDALMKQIFENVKDMPDEEYEYTSGSHLKSPVGTMQGTYQMTSTDGEEFEVTIPCFTLAVPGKIN